MDEFILQIFQSELFACCANVALLVPISLQNTIDCGQQHIATKIKFSSIVQERVLEIFLDDDCPPAHAFLCN